jgi:hypothetical protein
MTSIARAQLDGAVRDGIVSAEQAEKLVAYFGTKGVSQEQALHLRPRALLPGRHDRHRCHDSCS